MTPEVERINEQLKEHFGKTDNGDTIFRVVWSEDQYEKRMSKYSLSGIESLQPQMLLRPKYKQWIHNKYILERLVAVPGVNADTLDIKVSYEPIFVFEDNAGNALPPKFEPVKFIIENLLAAINKTNFSPKYPDVGESVEEKDARLAKIQGELFGNETEVGDALAHKQGIVVPHNYDKVKY